MCWITVKHLVEDYNSWRASLVAQLVKNPSAMQETLVRPLDWEDPLEKDKLPTPVFLGFPGGSAGKKSACNAGNLGSIPGLGWSPEEGYGNPLQHSGLENSMDKGDCQATVWTRYSWDFPSDRVVKTPYSQFRDHGFTFWSQN